jgi:23S rRNA maturation mini-RNase III
MLYGFCSNHVETKVVLNKLQSPGNIATNASSRASAFEFDTVVGYIYLQKKNRRKGCIDHYKCR